MRNAFASLSSPQRMQLFLAAVGMFAGVALGWAILAGFLSLLSWWGVALVTIALGVVVYVRGGKERQRQFWIDTGHCAACGYELRGLPTPVCPECGRDGRLDEPVWRRLRREHDAKFGRDTSKLTGGTHLDDATVQKLLGRADVFDMER